MALRPQLPPGEPLPNLARSAMGEVVAPKPVFSEVAPISAPVGLIAPPVVVLFVLGLSRSTFLITMSYESHPPLDTQTPV